MTGAEFQQGLQRLRAVLAQQQGWMLQLFWESLWVRTVSGRQRMLHLPFPEGPAEAELFLLRAAQEVQMPLAGSGMQYSPDRSWRLRALGGGRVVLELRSQLPTLAPLSISEPVLAQLDRQLQGGGCLLVRAPAPMDELLALWLLQRYPQLGLAAETTLRLWAPGQPSWRQRENAQPLLWYGLPRWPAWCRPPRTHVVVTSARRPGRHLLQDLAVGDPAEWMLLELELQD